MTPGPGVGDLTPQRHPPNMSASPIASARSAMILSFILLTSPMVITRFPVLLFPLSAEVRLPEIIPHPTHGGLLVGDRQQLEPIDLPGMTADQRLEENGRK